MGSAAAGFVENKQKYQGNNYNKDAGLNWMDFQNRQYDPQLGRFLSIDPLAEATADVSPYVAMDNDPGNQVDPLGLQPEPPHMQNNVQLFRNYTLFASVDVTSSNKRFEQLSQKFNADFFRHKDKYASDNAKKDAVGESSAQGSYNTSGTNGSLGIEGMLSVANNNKGTAVSFDDGYFSGFWLPTMEVRDHHPDYFHWENQMYDAGYGQLLGSGFHDFAVGKASYDPYFRAAYYGYSPPQLKVPDAMAISIPVSVNGISGAGYSINIGYVGKEWVLYHSYNVQLGTPNVSAAIGLSWSYYRGPGSPSFENFGGYGRGGGGSLGIFSGSYTQGLDRPGGDVVWDNFQFNVGTPGASVYYAPMIYTPSPLYQFNKN